MIEDDQDIRDLLTLLLTRMGFAVHAVGDGAEGVAAAWEHDPDLVTVDLNLPDMDGLDVARHIRARSQAPMLFITARSEVDDELAGMASGAAAYLTKPFRPPAAHRGRQSALPCRTLDRAPPGPPPLAGPSGIVGKDRTGALGLVRPSGMGENSSAHDKEPPPRAGVNDHVWEREHRHPTAEQAKAIGYRRRDAEAKLEQHQQEARHKTEEESEGPHE